MKTNHLKVILFYVLVIVAIIVIVSTLLHQKTAEKLIFSDVLREIDSGNVTELFVDEDYLLTMKLADGTTKSYQLRDLNLFLNFCGDSIDEQISAGTLKAEFEPQTVYPWWLQLLPTFIVILVVVILFWVFMANQASGGPGGRINSFGKARVKMPSTNAADRVTFKDVAGADEEKAELVEIVDFLKDPGKFTKLGAKIPHGVLLVGPPGTGKTLLAKAVAGEAGVPFFSISGSDFVEMYVGVGASRVRDLFETARKAPASIVFIDEIDAVGRHRGAGLGGGHDEREQTLNQLLVEMDGFGSHDGIIVIAATNRPDILDPALLRPGRFDRQITVSYPDINGRVEILRVHARNKPFEDDVDFERIAKTTVGFTGADLANLLNEAALLAARRNKVLIGMEEIDDAFIKVIAGPKKKSRQIKESEKKKTAFHEAGHALLAYFLPTQDPVQQISIIPSGNALGYTLNPPVEDRYSVYKSELKEGIAMLLGGRAAEQLVFGDVSGGASNDIERATKQARNMVMKLGMSDLLGPVNYGGEGGEVFLGRDFNTSSDHSDATAAKIDEEVHKIIAEAYELALNLLRDHMDKLTFVAEYLVKVEVMDGDQFKAAMEDGATFEGLDEIAADKKRRSQKANSEQEEKLRAEAEEAARREAEENPEDPDDPEDSEDLNDQEDQGDQEDQETPEQENENSENNNE